MIHRPGPIPLRPLEECGAEGGSRIRRILGRPTRNERVSALIERWEAPGGAAWRASWRDATRETPTITPHGATALHVLWTGHAGPHYVRAGWDDAEDSGLATFEVAPGDTVTIPPGRPYRLGAGVIGFTLEPGARAPAAPSTLVPPTHGLPVFHRFNRRTICSATAALVLERWKLTHPLELPLDPDRWHYLANLVTPVALAWPNGTELLGRIDSRLLPPGLTGITLVPGGLGYVLLGYVPDLRRDVVAPLRGAGYDADAIAALGVPRELLES